MDTEIPMLWAVELGVDVQLILVIFDDIVGAVLI